MISYFCVPLILVMLLSKMCGDANKTCQVSTNVVEVVRSCPASKTEWVNAASKKNCRKQAVLEKCTMDEKLFVYHCVINKYANALLEVCAPPTIIFGYCTTFNNDSGIIPHHAAVPCNEIFPKCDPIYISSDAYKYPDCYQLAYNKRTSFSKAVTTTPGKM